MDSTSPPGSKAAAPGQSFECPDLRCQVGGFSSDSSPFYCTAMVTGFDAMPPMVRATSTALVEGVVSGTCTLTW